MARKSESPFVWRALRRRLTAKQRSAVATTVARLLGWQGRMRDWPSLGTAPNATPFVSLYANGRLCGCYGSDEGNGGERLARAFVRALSDARFGGVAPRERDVLVAQVAYPFAVENVSAEDALERLEVGRHGVALRTPTGAAVILLPQVARDEGMTPSQLLASLATKAGLAGDGWQSAPLALFESDDVVVRRGESAARPQATADAAAGWLARCIDDKGAMTYGIDGRRRQRHAVGPMHHGRVAMALRALSDHGSAADRLERARKRLAREIDRGLRDGSPAQWPEHPALVIGTVALACLAGVDRRRQLSELIADATVLREHPWHAAQAALALGRDDTPPKLWRVCTRDARQRPWAPWTAMAARLCGDGETLAQVERALVDSIARSGPHPGGVRITDVPELAQTAVVIEALASLPSASTRRAVAAAAGFVRRWQFLTPGIPAPLDPDMVAGAFPISPVVDAARCDVTAHALRALLALERRGAGVTDS